MQYDKITQAENINFIKYTLADVLSLKVSSSEESLNTDIGPNKSRV